MVARQLSIPEAYEFTPKVFPDQRGAFTCPYIAAEFAEVTGYELTLAQVNHSRSARGVIRGVHFAQLPPSQAKFVYCSRGSGLDVVVDIRLGSPTFGQHDAALIDAERCNAVFVPEGLGHAFFALEEDTVLTYLCSTGYAPEREHGIDPLDPALGLPWPSDIPMIRSAKDVEAPSLEQVRERGLLPDYQACLDFYSSLRG
ncbi:dTDP-4-dehydrorhamnose 3,5-epimerase family protein [Sciscionella sediminilitoris]|uniref:dTDP-4-dehydrorhamnose 3,5-epimerase family protein n=1 Tax=Sciscionella sediminilitoris TaxID=1445613 RepID=UPI0005605241|nr:dTDP-4-dehydrorhamnose 3,5-epimerase family protein [Sciscionella sp. SE31]